MPGRKERSRLSELQITVPVSIEKLNGICFYLYIIYKYKQDIFTFTILYGFFLLILVSNLLAPYMSPQIHHIALYMQVRETKCCNWNISWTMFTCCKMIKNLNLNAGVNFAFRAFKFSLV